MASESQVQRGGPTRAQLGLCVCVCVCVCLRVFVCVCGSLSAHLQWFVSVFVYLLVYVCGDVCVFSNV